MELLYNKGDNTQSWYYLLANTKPRYLYKGNTGYLFWVVGEWDPIDPQTSQAITIVLVYSPKLDSKILLLKTPHIQVIRHGETKWVPIRKLHLSRITFIVLKGPMQEGKICHQSHPATNTVSSNNDCPGKISPWERALNWISPPRDGTHTWYCFWGKEPVSRP